MKRLLTPCQLATLLLCGCTSDSSGFAGPSARPSDVEGLLKPAPGYEIVQRECTLCHSEKLITQNRASRGRWTQTIRWMQKTQNLRSFSAEEEDAILDYLTENYGPRLQGRRAPLIIDEWYVFKP